MPRSQFWQISRQIEVIDARAAELISAIRQALAGRPAAAEIGAKIASAVGLARAAVLEG